MNRRFAAFALAPALLSASVAAAQTPAAPASSSAIIPLPLQPIVGPAQRTCTARTPSGLGYAVLKQGAGPKAGATDYVLINYIGYLAASGAVFDQAQTAPMTVDGVIPGFGEGLKMIPRGSIYRFCIPAALGYGAEAQGPIPANSDLVFQVELLDSRSAAEVEAMRRQAGAATGGGLAPTEAPAPKP